MDPSRRTFALTLGALASSSLWDRVIAEAQGGGTVTADTLRALLEAQGGAGIFNDPARFEELRAAAARSAANVAALRSFPVPDEVPPAVMFARR